MKLRAVAALVPLSLALVLVGAAPPVAAQSTGWIRWGNWSPSAPNFDIYLNSFGGSGMTVIRHVRYGHVSVYRAIPTGQYTVAMRDRGAPAPPPRPGPGRDAGQRRPGAPPADAVGQRSGRIRNGLHDREHGGPISPRR